MTFENTDTQETDIINFNFEQTKQHTQYNVIGDEYISPSLNFNLNMNTDSNRYKYSETRILKELEDYMILQLCKQYKI